MRHFRKCECDIDSMDHASRECMNGASILFFRMTDDIKRKLYLCDDCQCSVDKEVL